MNSGLNLASGDQQEHSASMNKSRKLVEIKVRLTVSQIIFHLEIRKHSDIILKVWNTVGIVCLEVVVIKFNF